MFAFAAGLVALIVVNVLVDRAVHRAGLDRLADGQIGF